MDLGVSCRSTELALKVRRLTRPRFVNEVEDEAEGCEDDSESLEG